VIDGRRRGVRESLEDQTMNMAKNAAKLISENLKYPDGTPVQCVISDTNIGGCARRRPARRSSRKRTSGVADGDAVLVLRDRDHGHQSVLPRVWGFNGTSARARSIAALLAGCAQKGLPALAFMAQRYRTAPTRQSCGRQG